MGGSIAQQGVPLTGKPAGLPLHIGKKHAAQRQRCRAGRTGSADDHQADRQHQQLKIEPGAKVCGKHAAAKAVAQHQQQTAHAVQLARTKVDGKITIRYLPGQQVAHRVIILEVAVHDLVPDLIIGGKTAHCGKPGQHQQQKQPRCCAFELLFCCLHQR